MNPNKIHLQLVWFSIFKNQMKSFLLFTLALLGLFLTSCNTFIGLGRDMRIGGEAMENTANKASGGSTSGGGDTSGAPVY